MTDLDVAALATRAGVFRGSAPDGILRTNEQFLEITGLSPTAARGWDWLVAVQSEDRDRLRRALEAACRAGARSAFPIRMQVRPGVVDRLRVIVTGTPVGDGSYFFVGSIEHESDESVGRRGPVEPIGETVEDPFQVLLDSLAISLAYVAPDGVIEFANPQWIEQTGADVDGAVFDALELDADAVDDPLVDAIGAQCEWDGVRTVAGRETNVSVAPVPGDSGGGVVLTLLPVVSVPGPAATGPEPAADPGDGTESFGADWVDTQVADFAGLLDASPEYGVIVTPAGSFLHANRAACELLGLDAGSVAGVDATTFVSFETVDASSLSETANDRLTTDGGFTVSGQLLVLDGDPVFVDMTLFPLTTPDGHHHATVIVARGQRDPIGAGAASATGGEQWYRTLVQHTALLVVVIDEDQQLKFVSPLCGEMLGYEAELLVGEGLGELVPVDDQPAIATALEAARAASEPVLVETRIRRADDELRAVEIYVEDRVDDPVIQGFVLSLRDVTEFQEQVSAREASESAFNTVVGAAPVAIFAVDTDGLLTLWNPACEKLFGWSAEELLGERPPFVTDAQRVKAALMTEKLLRGETVAAPARFVCRDGSRISTALSTAPLRRGGGPVTSFVTVVVDVTDRELAIDELERMSEVDRFLAQLARSMVDVTPETVGDRVAEALGAVASRSGADRAALLVRRLDRVRAQWPVDACVDPLVPGEHEPGAFVEPPAADGSVRAGWVLAGQAGPLGALVLHFDRDPDLEAGDLDPLELITTAIVAAADRVDAEMAVRVSERRYRKLAEHSKDLVVVVGADLQPRYLSPSAGRFLGMEESLELDAENPMVHPEDRDEVVARMTEIATAETGTSSELITARMRRADGEFRWVEFVATNLLDEPSVRGIVLNGRDVTKRRAMEERVRGSERRFRGLVQNMAEALVVLAPDGRVKYSTPSAGQMMGFDEGHGIGATALSFVVEEDRSRAAEIVARAFTEPGTQGPIRLRVLGAGGEVRVLEAHGRNLLNDPEIEGVVVTARDITDNVAAAEFAQRSEARFSALVENLSDVITIVSPEGEILYTSPAARTLFGFEAGDSSYTDPLAQVHPDDRDLVAARIAEQIEGSSTEPVRFRLRDALGGWRSVETIARDLSADPSIGGIVVTTRDVSERTKAETLVADQARVLTLIARGAQLQQTLGSICGVLEHQVGDAAFAVFLVEPGSEQLVLGAGPRIPVELAEACTSVAIDPTARYRAAMLTQAPSDPSNDWRTDQVRSALTAAGIAATWSTPIMDSNGVRLIGLMVGFFGASREPRASETDVVEMFAQTAAIAIERQVAEDLLAHRANHDSLTGLPNRVLFLEFLSLALSRTGRDESAVAVLFLDLDRFKHINDGLGHDAGDELLRVLASRLQEAMRPSDVVARFGGDEFTVLCDGLDPERADHQVRDVARRLLDVIESPIAVEGEDRRLSASVGIAIAAPDVAAEDLLREADAAMYEAKQRGKARWEVFDDEMRSSIDARLDLEHRLERGIENDEFRLFLQPIVDLATGRCVGAEALLRWQDPEAGLVTPDSFIGLAEDSGLIIPLGEWALAEACRIVSRWEEVGLLPPDFTMAVNLSARQVAQADLAQKVKAVIERHGSMASRLCLEITESVLMQDSSVEAMNSLKALGVRLSIDDFGTGYSSLGYLKRFPVDSVKVDRSFVDGLGTEGEDSAIVTAVVSLGHALGLSVVAEGVETSGQLQALLALGCDRAQGYWFSGPRSPKEFAGLLHAQPWVAVRSEWAG